MEEIATINNEIKIDNPLPKKFFTKERKRNLILLGITILVMIANISLFVNID